MQEDQLEAQQKQMALQAYQHPIFEQIILRYAGSPDPRKVQALMNMPPTKSKKE